MPNKPVTIQFSVAYHSAANSRVVPEKDELEDRFLHRIFLLVHRPASWNFWQLMASLLTIAFLVWLSWWALASTPVIAAGIYLVFALTDWWLLWWLSHSGRSFGPVGSQLLIKTVPRVGVALFSALVVWTFDSSTVGLWTLVLLQLGGSLIYLWGTLYEASALTMTQQAIQSPHLSPYAPPIRLLHLSDLHVERLTRREAHLLELVEQVQPDIIVITGDYLNLSYVDDPIARAEVRKVLARLEAPYGVYATLGSPLVDPRNTTPSLFDGLNIRLLRDEVAVLNFADGRTLSLLGLECEHDFESDASVFQKLVTMAPVDSVRVLLYHSPELMPLVQQHPIDLYLCGHTHGGQIRLPFYGAVITSSVTGKQYEMGPYIEQNTMLYVSRGIGLEGMSAPRMRLLCPPEIVSFTFAATPYESAATGP
jgi:predicted MPP superfamily phosphohydrolase